ncbi:MAG: hypothetical protein QM619_14265 [Micropruina sp.]|uniref:hypothetical protein n=1 Tax=Micropruina sp. TaxID=2737536 RepID=UPI0039E62982
MGELRLYAIGVDEVRDVFCAPPELAAEFRRIVAEEFPPRTLPKPPGMLSKLGPLFRRPPGAVVVGPDTPLESDVANLLAGRFIQPDRQPVAWTLLEAYLAATAWSRHRIELDVTRFNDLEFDLARSGLDPRFGLGKLVNRELGVPLQTYPGLSTGYTPHAVALDAAAAWRNVLPQLSPPNHAVAEPYAAWLAQFHHYAQAAPAKNRPIPDLIVVYRA